MIKFFLITVFIQSGMILFFDQSPPPITFPALAVAIPIFFLLLKKECKYDWNAISTDAFDAL